MGIGTSLFLIAVGAILKFAVTDGISGVDLTTVGLILMIVGIAGLLLSLFYEMAYRDRRRAAVVEQPVVRERYREPL